jgi:hypothetical protein
LPGAIDVGFEESCRESSAAAWRRPSLCSFLDSNALASWSVAESVEHSKCEDSIFTLAAVLIDGFATSWTNMRSTFPVRSFGVGLRHRSNMNQDYIIFNRSLSASDTKRRPDGSLSKLLVD